MKCVIPVPIKIDQRHLVTSCSSSFVTSLATSSNIQNFDPITLFQRNCNVKKKKKKIRMQCPIKNRTKKLIKVFEEKTIHVYFMSYKLYSMAYTQYDPEVNYKILLRAWWRTLYTHAQLVALVFHDDYGYTNCLMGYWHTAYIHFFNKIVALYYGLH